MKRRPTKSQKARLLREFQLAGSRGLTQVDTLRGLGDGHGPVVNFSGRLANLKADGTSSSGQVVATAA